MMLDHHHWHVMAGGITLFSSLLTRATWRTLAVGCERCVGDVKWGCTLN